MRCKYWNPLDIIPLKYGTPIYLSIPMIALIVFMSVVSFEELTDKTPGWTAVQEAHMIKTEINSINITNNALAELTDVELGTYKAEMEKLANKGERVLSGVFTFTKPSTPYNTLTDTPPGGLDSNGRNGDYSAWFSIQNNDLTYLNNITYMNFDWSSVYKSYDGIFQGIYFGAGDLFVHLPFMVFSEYPTGDYDCGQSGYRSSCRIWYRLAIASPNDVIFTPPYPDAGTGVVLITVAKAIKVNNVVVGVMAIDISLDTLGKNLQRKVLETGYSFMTVDDTSGTIVFHHKVNPESTTTESIYDVEPITPAQYLNIRNSDHGDLTYGGKFLTWKKTSIVDNIVYTSVEWSKITEPTKKIKDDIDSNVMVATIVVVCVTIATILILIAVTCVITAPIGVDMRSIANSFNTGNINDIENGTHASKEMYRLGELGSTINQIINFAYKSAMSLSPSALNLYNNIEEIMKASKNEYGLVAVDAARANYYARLNDDDSYEIADELYTKVIEKSKHLYASRPDKNDHRFSAIVGERLMNHGVLTMNGHYYDDAQALFDSAREYFDNAGHTLGITQVDGNEGTLLFLTDRRGDAYKLFKKSYNTAMENYNMCTNDTERHICKTNVQYSAFNLGKYYYDTGDIENAIKYLREAICIFNEFESEMDTILVGKVLTILSKIMEENGQEENADELRSYIPGSRKNVYMLLDLSTSMRAEMRREDMNSSDSNDSVITRKDAMMEALDVFIDNLHYGDTLTVYGFNSDSKIISKEEMIKNNNVNGIRNRVIDNAELSGGTALYRCITDVIEHIKTSGSMDRSLIVGISDGKDTSSHRVPRGSTKTSVTLDSTQKLVDESGVHMALVAVCMKDTHTKALKELTHGEQNLFLTANNPEELKRATETSARMMEGQIAPERMI
jgi:tetratricopeptide (TPR) repeat protein